MLKAMKVKSVTPVGMELWEEMIAARGESVFSCDPYGILLKDKDGFVGMEKIYLKVNFLSMVDLTAERTLELKRDRRKKSRGARKSNKLPYFNIKQ